MNKIRNTGYHGTTRTNAEKILQEQSFINSTKVNEWLGDGVYFFAYRSDAEWWVKANRYKNQKTEILKAELAYTKEQLLDLDNSQQLLDMEKFLQNYVQLQSQRPDISSEISSDISTEPWDKKLCWGCNVMKKLFPEIGIIIYTFHKKNQYQYTPLRTNQRQICVSDHSIIKHISRAMG